MTVPTRILTLTMLLLLSLVLIACGSATTETLPPREEPAPTSEPVAPTDVPEAEPATETPAEPEAGQPVSEPVAAPSDGVSFQHDILPVFENSCIRCHGGSRTEKGLDLRTYESLMRGSRNGAMLIPGDAENSEMAIQVISGEMPRRASKLLDEQIQLIVDWINQGALDN